VTGEAATARRRTGGDVLKLEALLGTEVHRRIASGGLARGLPRAAYLDRAVLDLEVERWFSRTWLLAGLVHELPEPGDLVPVPQLRLFLARDGEGAIRAFHNVCRHRGHELVQAPRRHCRAIVCPYHGWSYGLDGDLKSTSYFAGPGGGFAAGFEPAAFGLKPVRCERWHDWIFVNLDGEAPPLEAHLKALLARLGGIDLTRLQPFHGLEHGAVEANWKLVMENSLEPYHTPFVHAQTGAGIPLEDHYMVREAGLLGCGIDVPEAPARGLSEDGAIAADSQFLVVPPLLVFVLYAGRIVIVHRNLPSLERPGETWRSVHLYSLGPTPLSAAEIEDWKTLTHRIHVEEDGPVYESLQRGKLSPVTDDGGVLSPVWETAVQGFYEAWLEALDGG
jgi:choline monooxygenase